MNTATPLRIVIVDDYDVGRRGIVVALSRLFKDFNLVGEASNAEDALKLCEQTQPDVVLVDLVLPDIDGTLLIQMLHNKHPQTKIIALTGYDSDERQQAALAAGAVEYLAKDTPIDQLAATIRKASIP